jgi:hypothetical protein
MEQGERDIVHARQIERSWKLLEQLSAGDIEIVTRAEDRMILSFKNSLASVAACSIATLAFHAGAAAESIENQCRIAVRVEMMGPDCRMSSPKTSSGGYTAGDPCYILGDTKTAYYIDKVIECVKRGGPGKR